MLHLLFWYLPPLYVPANYGYACMLPSHDPIAFIHPTVSQNQAIWARASGTDWVKSAVNVSSSALYRLTIHIRSDDTIRPNTNTLFGALFSTEANTNQIFGTSLKSLQKNCKTLMDLDSPAHPILRTRQTLTTKICQFKNVTVFTLGVTDITDYNTR